jgi:uncharacterized protein YndB with AHSA1/START domain
VNALILAITALAVLAAVALVVAARRPDEFVVTRSARLQAPAGRIFPLISDLRAHEAWSTFDPPDPAVRKTHSGAPQGAGAVYEWAGSGRAGAGRLAITDAVPASTVDMRLDMLRPIRASNQVRFTLQPDGDATVVTWHMAGRTPFVGKVMHLFFNMDRMVGREFESSLQRLGELAATDG